MKTYYKEVYMYKTIFKYLEDTAKKYPSKLAFVDEERSFNYHMFVEGSRSVDVY